MHHALITGTLWRDPVARTAKTGKRFVTALIKSGTLTDALWINIICFDTDAQEELLRLTAGDSLSVQVVARISLFEKSGVTRASLDMTAAKVLTLRQPKTKATTARRELPKRQNAKQSERAPPMRATWDNGFEGTNLA